MTLEMLRRRNHAIHEFQNHIRKIFRTTSEKSRHQMKYGSLLFDRTSIFWERCVDWDGKCIALFGCASRLIKLRELATSTHDSSTHDSSWPMNTAWGPSAHVKLLQNASRNRTASPRVLASSSKDHCFVLFNKLFFWLVHFRSLQTLTQMPW
jgi:hypothetical protein